MAFQYASQVQLEAARETMTKYLYAIEQFTQGSQRNTRVSAAKLAEMDAFNTAVNVAIDAITAAVVDSTPSAFAFVDVTGAVVSTVYCSNQITLAGLTDNVAVAITVTGGLYSVNNGPFVSAAGTVVLGDKIRVKVTSSGSAATAVNGVLTVGGVSDTYTVTTA